MLDSSSHISHILRGAGTIGLSAGGRARALPALHSIDDSILLDCTVPFAAPILSLSASCRTVSSRDPTVRYHIKRKGCGLYSIPVKIRVH
ncbi:MAG: hypothetical protein QM400_08445 [Spirochaetota bacterium]|nr:hypothetical protein [Spirochaetota bacterium]